jgi:hypothetical protein
MIRKPMTAVWPKLRTALRRAAHVATANAPKE